MGPPELLPRRYTAEEYFALKTQSAVRHEFFEGDVFAMAGESIAYNTVSINVTMACRHYTHPAVVVSCDPQDQHESRRLPPPCSSWRYSRP